MTIISISKNTKQKVHTFTVVMAELVLAVALGCGMWYALGDRLTFTIQSAEPAPVAASTPEPVVYDPTQVPAPLAELYDKNPDARQFVMDYPAKHDLHPEIDLSALKDTNAVPRLYQWDERWGYESYNENFLALSGCGPTCLSMVDIYLTGHTEHDPLWMARYAEEHGYNEVGNGTKWALFSEGASALGLRAEGVTLSYEFFSETLSSGTPVICIMGPGDFTEHGHYIVLTGIDAEGNITVNDPNSCANSERTWTFEQLKPQIRGGWIMTSTDAHSTSQPGIG